MYVVDRVYNEARHRHTNQLIYCLLTITMDTWLQWARDAIADNRWSLRLRQRLRKEERGRRGETKEGGEGRGRRERERKKWKKTANCLVRKVKSFSKCVTSHVVTDGTSKYCQYTLRIGQNSPRSRPNCFWHIRPFLSLFVWLWLDISSGIALQRLYRHFLPCFGTSLSFKPKKSIFAWLCWVFLPR